MKIIRELIGDTVKEFFHEPEVRKEVRKIKGSGVPSQEGHAGEFLTTDGTTSSWVASSPGGTTIYTGDGSLSGDREVDMNGKKFAIIQNGQQMLYWNPTPGEEFALLRSLKSDGTYKSELNFATNDDCDFALFSDKGDNESVGIIGNAVGLTTSWGMVNSGTDKIAIDGTAHSITYTADTHTFSGNFKSGTDNEWDLDGHSIQFESDEKYYFQIFPSVDDGASQSAFYALFGDNTVSGVNMYADNSTTNSQLQAQFDESHGASIALSADVSQSSIEYEADTHTFNINTNFTIQNGNPDRFGLLIIPTAGEETAGIKAPNDAAEVGAFFTSNTLDGYFWEINAEQAKVASIVGRGDDGTITYTGDTHTIIGKVSLNSILNLAVFTNSSPVDGDIWRADNTNTGLKVRINGVTKTITVS